MSLAFSIRTATAADVSSVLHFIQQLAIYEKLEHACVATEAALLKTLFAPNSSVRVLLIEEHPSMEKPWEAAKNASKSAAKAQAAGFALYFYNYSTFLAKPGIYLEDLFVLPEHRGKGYGKALMVHIATIAVAEGCGRFEWSVLDWNEPSIQFYRSIGAVGMNDWTVQRVTGDALVRLAGAI